MHPPQASPGLFRSGWALLWRRRWQWLVLTHLALATVLVMYFLMVLANSAGFAYSFWNEPPPNDAADRFAVLSLLVLAISVLTVGYVIYGAYCVMLLDVSVARMTSVGSVLRRTMGPALRSWWWGLPLFLAGAVSVVLVTPALLGLSVLVPAPFGVLLARKPLVSSHLAFVRSISAYFWAINVVVAVGGLVVWLVFLSSFILVERFDGLVELLVLPLGWAGYLILALSAALAAACTVVLVPKSSAQVEPHAGDGDNQRQEKTEVVGEATGIGAPAPANLRVFREPWRWQDRLRSYVILVDGAKSGRSDPARPRRSQ